MDGGSWRLRQGAENAQKAANQTYCLVELLLAPVLHVPLFLCLAGLGSPGERTKALNTPVGAKNGCYGRCGAFFVDMAAWFCGCVVVVVLGGLCGVCWFEIAGAVCASCKVRAVIRMLRAGADVAPHAAV